MYGYSESKEIALYMDAVSQLDDLIALKNNLQKAIENEADLTGCAAKFLFQIRSIRNTLAIDGNVWESRPYDLLTIQSESDAVNSSNVTSSAPFLRAQKWEKLLAFFFFEDQFRRFIDAKAEKLKREEKAEKKKKEEYLSDVLTGLTHEDLSKFFKKPLRILDQSLTRLDSAPTHRLKYDIFDNAISYTERVARWQEYTVPADDDVICIPESFCQKYQSIELFSNAQVNTPHFFELLMFTTMLFRHLQRIGITQELLTDDDYWHIPGGMRGLGAYQRNCTAETFFSRVQKSIEFFDSLFLVPPVRLIALNGEWMANMDKDVFKDFSDAHTAYSQSIPDPAAAKTAETKTAASVFFDEDSPFAGYSDVLFIKPVPGEIRKHGSFFTLEGDGGLTPSFTLSKEYGPSKPVPVKRMTIPQMLLDHSWKKNDEQAWNEFWPSVENYLRHEADDIINQKSKKKSFTLNWMKYASSLDKRGSQLILGYLCSLGNPLVVFDIQKESDNTPDAAFCQAANRYLEKDNAESFDAYYANITNDQSKTSIQLTVKEKDVSTWSVEIQFTNKPIKEKKPAAPEMDVDSGESALLLLKDFFGFNLKDKNPDELNNLFSVAWTLWKERPPKFSMDPGSQLLVEKNTLQDNLWSFCETVLLWHATRNNTPSKTCSFPEKPFDKPEDVAAFSLFCRHLSYQWFGWWLKSIDKAASPVQIALSNRTKTPGLCEDDDSAFPFVFDPGSSSNASDEAMLQSLFVKGFRRLIHKSFFTNTASVSYAPAKKPDKPQESRILYFLGTVLLYFGFKEGIYTCSWDPEQNTFTVDQKVLAFSTEHKSADNFATYLLQDQFTKSKKRYSLLCIPSAENSSEFTLSIT